MEEFEDAKRIAKYAINIYKASWGSSEKKFRRVLQIQNDDEILLNNFLKEDIQENDRIYVPRYMIFTEKSTQSIVFAIRGTNK